MSILASLKVLCRSAMSANRPRTHSSRSAVMAGTPNAAPAGRICSQSTTTVPAALAAVAARAAAKSPASCSSVSATGSATRRDRSTPTVRRLRLAMPTGTNSVPRMLRSTSRSFTTSGSTGTGFAKLAAPSARVRQQVRRYAMASGSSQHSAVWNSYTRSRDTRPRPLILDGIRPSVLPTTSG